MRIVDGWEVYTLEDAFAPREFTQRSVNTAHAKGYKEGFVDAIQFFRDSFYRTKPNRLTQVYDRLWEHWASRLGHWFCDVANGKANCCLPPKPEALLCIYCGTRIACQRDHVIPRSRGGSDDPSNLVWACADCNHAKGEKELAEWLGASTA